MQTDKITPSQRVVQERLRRAQEKKREEAQLPQAKAVNYNDLR